jgi:signal transduction histidine kinase
MRTILLLLVFGIAYSSISAQSSAELEAELGRIKERFNTHWQEIIPEVKAFKVLAEKAKDPVFMQEAYNLLGGLYFRQSKMDSAMMFYLKSAELNEELGNEESLAKNYVNMAFIHQQKAEYDKAVEMATAAGRVFQNLNNYKGIALTYNVIGSVYYYQQRYLESAEAMRNYVKYAEMTDDLNELGSAYGNLSSALDEIDPEEALIYKRKQAEILEKTGNKLGLGNALHNIGAREHAKGNYKDAVNYLEQALKLAKEVPVPRLEMESYYNLALSFRGMGNQEKAQQNLLACLEMVKETEDKYYEMRALITLGDVYADQGQYSKAFEAMKQGQELRYTIINEENLGKVAELEAQFETELKESQIIALQQEKELQDLVIQRNRVVQAGLGLSLFLLLGFGYMFQSRNKARQQKEIERLEVQLKEEQLAAVISSQENERKRFAEDLHDGFGQLISALKLNMGRMDAGNPIPLLKEERERIYQSSLSILEEMYGEVRAIAFNLMPTILVKKGLVAAVEQLADRFNQSGQIHFSVQAFELEEKLDDVKEISLYRIVQEIMNNIAKYSGANEVEIQFVKHEDQLILMIEDNGQGFDPKMLEASIGNGWKNIRSRLNLIKASLDLDTMPGRKGNTYTINAPLQQMQIAHIPQTTL